MPDYNVQVPRLIPLLLLAAAACSPAQDTRVILLGTGTPNPEPERSGPAAAVVTGDRVYLIDCGPGVVRRAAQAGIRMDQLTRLFVTHLHSDHTAGYPDVILTPPNAGRVHALEAYGPPGLAEMTTHLLQAYAVDLDARLHGMQPHTAAGYEVHAHDVQPGEVYRDEAVRVVAFAVPHGDFPGAYGYRFEARDKVIVFSGDTTYSEALAAAARGCDILVHEVYSAKALSGRTADWQRYHSAFHTSGADVGRIAAQVRPRKLVLYHILHGGESSGEVISEVRARYPGEIVYGRDLDVIR